MKPKATMRLAINRRRKSHLSKTNRGSGSGKVEQFSNKLIFNVLKINITHFDPPLYRTTSRSLAKWQKSKRKNYQYTTKVDER